MWRYRGDGQKGRAEQEVAERRRLIVEAIRSGASQRAVATRFGVGLGTVQRALARAAETADGTVEWADRTTAPHRTRRTPPTLEVRVAAVRAALAESVVGDHGAVAIHRALVAAGDETVPSVRTIARIIERTGLLERRRRIRRPAPPRGWYLSDVAAGRSELDAFDAIIDLPVLRGHADILTGVSLHGGDPDAWPGTGVSAALTVEALTARWRRAGLPGFVQFDNDTRFLGSHGQPDILGAVPLFALGLGVTPVFAPLVEQGFQASIEGFNGYWQRRVWRRTGHVDLAGLVTASDTFITALRAHRAARIEAAPPRLPWPPSPSRIRRGRIVFIRRTSAAGRVSILGRDYLVDPTRVEKLVRVELDFDDLSLRAYALSRRDPTFQPLLAEVPYRLPENRAWVTRMY